MNKNTNDIEESPIYTPEEIHFNIEKEKRKLQRINSFLVFVIVVLAIILICLHIKNQIQYAISNTINDFLNSELSIDSDVTAGLLNSLGGNNNLNLDDLEISESDLNQILNGLNYDVINTDVNFGSKEAEADIEINQEELEQMLSPYMSKEDIDSLNNMLTIDLSQNENGDWVVSNDSNGELQEFLTQLITNIFESNGIKVN